MIISVTTSAGSAQYTFDILNQYKSTPVQKVDYITSANGKTQAYNYGSTFDKWFSELTITGEKDSIFAFSNIINKYYGNVTVTLGSNELIFGAGIDYTYPIVCNITNSSVPFNQETFPTAEMKISLKAIGSNSLQLVYKSATPSTIPTNLFYQTPIDRTVVRSDISLSALSHGNDYKIVEVDDSGEPINRYAISLVFDHDEETTAQIEKFVNTQRSTTFVWPNLNKVDLFENQATDKVMINKFVTQQVLLNRWKTTIGLLVNV